MVCGMILPILWILVQTGWLSAKKGKCRTAKTIVSGMVNIPDRQVDPKSCQQFANHVAMHVGKPKFAALVLEGESFMVESE
jgi:hypothetical protein